MMIYSSLNAMLVYAMVCIILIDIDRLECIDAWLD